MELTDSQIVEGLRCRDPVAMDRMPKQVRRRQRTLAVIRATLLGVAAFSVAMLLPYRFRDRAGGGWTPDLKNEGSQQCCIRVVPDRVPIARVISPVREQAVRPDEVIEVKFEAHDDHGIARAELVVYRESAGTGEPPIVLSVEEIPLGEQQNSLHLQATVKLDLSEYEFHDAAGISFAVRVSDNRAAASLAGHDANPWQTSARRTLTATSRRLFSSSAFLAAPDSRTDN